MSLTKCPTCLRLTFISATSCPSCGKGFPPGSLQAQSDKEEKAFTRKWGSVFLSVLLCMLGVLLFAMLRP
jgi:hypothetical protein